MSGMSRRMSVVGRPMVAALFVSSCLLSIVSWYTTQQGMALYLAPWFALLASLGVQSALLLVAWFIGFSRSRRALFIAVYAITAVVSIAFSYAALFTWFSARERPALVERRLYDSLNSATDQSQQLLTGAISEGEKHVLALEEMTDAEKAHGYISRAQDADPYLAKIREAVAGEAESYSAGYPEGSGAGLRYTAFDRYTMLARQSLARLQAAQQALIQFRATLKPLDPTESQLRRFREIYDAIPWQDVRETLHTDQLALPEIPAYTDFVERSASGQEDLMIAFQEPVSAPTGRHGLALALAAFIDLVVFLLAYASGPYFFGAPEERWISAGAVLDSSDNQVFARNFLRKLIPGVQGTARMDAAGLSPGEQQFCIILSSKGLAATSTEDGKLCYLIDRTIHEQLLESLAEPGIALRASSPRAI
jgi:hypothetical protein